MFSLNCKGRLLTITSPIVMGILNCTPDSFYAGSRQQTLDDVLRRAEAMIADGATILDLGGQSTRPGSERVLAEEEGHRVLPAVEAVHKAFPQQILSIDTFYASVARDAVQAGASIVNDVSAGTIDNELLAAVAELGVPYVLTHMLGDPQTMQQNPRYADVTLEVFDALSFKLKELRTMGIHDVLVDPGFGFGKTATHNLQLLHRLSYFQPLEAPVVAGLSRKATVYKTLGTTAEKALNGTTVLHTIALLNGANVLRVHDVREAVEAIKLVEVYREANESEGLLR